MTLENLGYLTMKCERCGKGTQGYDLFDYCANCSRNLCAGCMEKGCCGQIPAASGMEADDMNDVVLIGIDRDTWKDRAEQAQVQVRELREALAFARSAIKCGEPWTDRCEEVINGAIDKTAPEG